METQVSNWGNLNELRNFPLDDRAHRKDDRGNVLPNDLLTGLQVWWPLSCGRHLYVSVLTVSPHLVTLILSAANLESDESSSSSSSSSATGDAIPGSSSSAESEFVDACVISNRLECEPVAVVNLARPISPFRNYPVEAIAPGAGGWVSFGRGLEELDGIQSWSFSDPQASRVLPKLGRAYNPLPVPSVASREDTSALEGLVQLKASGDLSIEEGYRTVNGQQVRCIIVGLREDLLPDAYESYAGPVGQRPESENCDQGIAIQSISGVSPGCNGNITIALGSNVTDSLGGPEGMVLDTAVDLSAVCGDKIPSLTINGQDFPCEPWPNGRPNLPDICFPEESSSSAEPDEPQEPLSSSSSVETAASSSSQTPCGALSLNFDAETDLTDNFSIADAAEWEVVNCWDELNAGSSSAGPGLNVLLGDAEDFSMAIADCDGSIVNDWFVHGNVRTAAGGAQAKAFFVVGYGGGNCYFVGIDSDRGRLLIGYRRAVGTVRIVGSVQLTSVSSPQVGDILRGEWSHVVAHVYEEMDGDHVISMWVNPGTGTPPWGNPSLRVNVSANANVPFQSGPAGMAVWSSRAFFDNFTIEDAGWNGSEATASITAPTPSSCD